MHKEISIRLYTTYRHVHLHMQTCTHVHRHIHIDMHPYMHIAKHTLKHEGIENGNQLSSFPQA